MIMQTNEYTDTDYALILSFKYFDIAIHIHGIGWELWKYGIVELQSNVHIRSVKGVLIHIDFDTIQLQT